MIKKFALRRSSFLSISGCLLILACYTVSVGIPLATAVSTPVFSAAVNLSNDGGKAKDPAVASMGNYVYVAWTEGSGGIMFRASNNSGVTWSPPTTSPAMRISPSGGSAAFPVMFTQYQNTSDVIVSWAQTVSKAGLQVFVATSSTHGANFTITRVSPSIANGTAITPSVAGWGHDLYVSWYEQEGCTLYNGTGCTMVSTSTNDGKSWGPAIQLNPSGDGEDQIVATQNTVYVVADGIWISSSTNAGGNWSVPLRLYHPTSIKGSVNYGREPWVAASEGYVYTIWEANSTASKSIGYQTFGRDSNNTGQSWTLNLTLSSTVKNDWEPENAAFGNSSYITFHSLANQGIYVTSTNNGGQVWSTPELLSPTGRASAFGHIFTSDGENVFVVWGQSISSGSSIWNAYVSYSLNGGATWSPPIDISNNSAGVAAGNQDVTLFALSSSGIHCFAAWTYTDGSSSQIYFAHS